MAEGNHELDRKFLEEELRLRRGICEQFPTDVQINRELGYLLYQLGRYKEAIDHYQRVTAAEPERADAWYDLGHTACQAGQFAIGEAALRKAISLGRDDAATQAALAASLYHLAKPEAAIEQARQALSNAPERTLRSLVHRMIGTWFEESGDVEGAVVHLQQAVEANPDDAHARHNLGVAYLWREQYPAALTHLETAARLAPANPATWATLGRAALLAGALETARNAFEQALVLNHDRGRFRAELAWVLDRMGEPAKAIEHGARALEEPLDPPERAWVYSILAHSHVQMGDGDQELRHREEAVAAAPDSCDALYDLGVAYYHRERFEEAIMHLLQVVAISPDDGDSWYALGLAAHRTGDYPAAQEALQKAIALGWDDVETQKELLIVLEAQNKWTETITQAKSLLQSTMDASLKVWLHCVLSNSCDRLGDVSQAHQHLEEARRLDPDDAAAHFNLGCEFHRRGNVEAALQELRRATTLDPEDAEYWLFFGQLLDEIGDWDKAAPILRRLLDTDQHGPARIILVTGLTRQERSDEAVQIARRGVEISPSSAPAWAALSLAFRKAGDAAAAEEAIDVAKKLDSNDAWVAWVEEEVGGG